MNLPSPDDFIDIHNHGGNPSPGVFCIENLLASEAASPDERKGMAYTAGIHPWHLSRENFPQQLEWLKKVSVHSNVIAIGEAGFDRLRGPGILLQKEAFAEEVRLSEYQAKPLYIHCVRSWEELIASHRELNPGLPWIVHGFRGKEQLARQLISRNMYISFWFDFIIRPESNAILKSLPSDKIFLETDGSNIDIREIYRKVAADLNLKPEELREKIYLNFMNIFSKGEA